jgi:predicted nucleotidyltransferase
MAQIKSSVKNSIVKTIRYLQNQITITEVILFGSYAAGTQHKHSDIDIAVISPDFENKDINFRAAISSKAKINGSIDVEIHPFALQSLKDARPTNFIGHILKTGKIIFKEGAFMV